MAMISVNDICSLQPIDGPNLPAWSGADDSSS